MTTSRRRSTILIVGYTPLARELIADLLRSRGFDSVETTSGEEALCKLVTTPADLVLLDEKLPGRDGLSVLQVLRRDSRWQHLPVILLGETPEAETVRIAAQLGIQGFLPKTNLTVDGLLARIQTALGVAQEGRDAPGNGSDRATASAEQTKPDPEPRPNRSGRAPAPYARPKRTRQRPRQTLDKHDVLTQIRRSLQEQPVPPVLEYVVQQSAGEPTRFRETLETIQRDTALTLRIMRFINSGFFSQGRTSRTLTEAAERIGPTGIRDAVVAVVAMDRFDGYRDVGLSPQRFWEHSLGTAAIAQSIAQAIGLADIDHVFLAGLLHDVGRAMLAALFPGEYRHILTVARQRGGQLESLERTVFGLGHGEVTGVVLGHMGMPAPVVEAASLHYLDVVHTRFTRIPRCTLAVILANRLAHALALGESGNPVIYPIDELSEIVGIDRTALATIGRATAGRITNTELFRDGHFGLQCLAPYARVLAAGMPSTVRATVLARQAPNDALSLLCEQLGWLNADRPQIAILYCPTPGELNTRLRELADLQSRVQTNVRALIISPHGALTDVDSEIHGQTARRLLLPVEYESFVQTIAAMITESSQPRPDPETRRDMDRSSFVNSSTGRPPSSTRAPD